MVSGIRIGTWNLERGRRSPDVVRAQREVLNAHATNVCVLTEPPAELSAPGRGRAISPSSPHDGVGPWVCIVGDGVEPVELPGQPRPLAVAAHTRWRGVDLVVFGSVLPWLGAATQVPEMALPGEPPAALFARHLRSQADDVRALCSAHPDALVVWAGDFNQALAGPNYGGSNANRALLAETLDELGFEAWNATAPHAIDGLYSIDLICGRVGQPREVVRIPPVVDGRVLSDHAGYVVELAIGGATSSG
jgi:hypothetical protein